MHLPVAGRCEHGAKLSGSIKKTEISSLAEW
jgi:hypothetical protein